MTVITEGMPTGVLTNLGNSNIYITYTNNGTITFPINTICDVWGLNLIMCLIVEHIMFPLV